MLQAPVASTRWSRPDKPGDHCLLVRNRHGQAPDLERIRDLPEAVQIVHEERKVHGIDPERRKASIVDEGGQGVHDGTADDSVDACARGDGAEVVRAFQCHRIEVPRRGLRAGRRRIAQERAELGGKHLSGKADFPHAQKNLLLSLEALEGGKQAGKVGRVFRQEGGLRDLSRAMRQARHPARKIGGHSGEVVQGPDDAPPSAGHPLFELRRFEILLEIDVGESRFRQPHQQGAPFPLVSGERAAFMGAPQREYDRTADKTRQPPRLTRLRGAEPIHAQLQEVESPAMLRRNPEIRFNGFLCQAEADSGALFQKSLL